MDMSGCEHLETAGAWVLGAVDEREAPRYAEHLRTCAECQAEVARLALPADTLALAAEREAGGARGAPPARARALAPGPPPPPPALRDRIRSVVESEAQLLRAAG